MRYWAEGKLEQCEQVGPVSLALGAGTAWGSPSTELVGGEGGSCTRNPRGGEGLLVQRGKRHLAYVTASHLPLIAFVIAPA